MVLLISGLLLWSIVHLSKAAFPAQRARLIASIGEMPYKGVFSLLILASLVMIIAGWRATLPWALYLPPPALRHLTFLLMPVAVVLFIAARAPTDIKQYIRHPQLTGVKLWAVAHLLANGEIRALVLFGGLLAWAVLEVILISRRDGAWVKPKPVGLPLTLVSTAIGLVLTAALMWAHPWFTGRQLLP